jgi:hypothetical protein
MTGGGIRGVMSTATCCLHADFHPRPPVLFPDTACSVLHINRQSADVMSTDNLFSMIGSLFSLFDYTPSPAQLIEYELCTKIEEEGERSWPILRSCPRTFLEKLSKTTQPLASNVGPPTK